MIKTGIFFWYGFIIDSDLSLKMIKAAGFDSVIFWWGDEFQALLGSKEKLHGRAQKLGLSTENVHLPYQYADSLWIDTLDGDALVDNYKRTLQSCRSVGINKAVIHLTHSKQPPPVSAIGMARMAKLVAFAEHIGVKIACENIEFPEHLDSVLRQIDSPCLGFCYDTGHHHVAMQNIDLLAKYGNRLLAIHLHDNDGITDQHRLPGDGKINWQPIIQAIKQTPYCGSYTLESTCRPLDDSSVKEAANYLRLARASLAKLIELTDRY